LEAKPELSFWRCSFAWCSSLAKALSNVTISPSLVKKNKKNKKNKKIYIYSQHPTNNDNKVYKLININFFLIKGRQTKRQVARKRWNSDKTYVPSAIKKWIYK
jgi:hypothetical protein